MKIILDYKYERKLREIERDILDRLRDMGRWMDSNNISNKDIYGIFLYYKYDSIRYMILLQKEDFNEKIELLKKYDYVYRGEIIIKPGRALVDTIGVDIEKYNI